MCCRNGATSFLFCLGLSQRSLQVKQIRTAAFAVLPFPAHFAQCTLHTTHSLSPGHPLSSLSLCDHNSSLTDSALALLLLLLLVAFLLFLFFFFFLLLLLAFFCCFCSASCRISSSAYRGEGGVQVNSLASGQQNSLAAQQARPQVPQQTPLLVQSSTHTDTHVLRTCLSLSSLRKSSLTSSAITSSSRNSSCASPTSSSGSPSSTRRGRSCGVGVVGQEGGRGRRRDGRSAAACVARPYRTGCRPLLVGRPQKLLLLLGCAAVLAHRQW